MSMSERIGSTESWTIDVETDGGVTPRTLLCVECSPILSGLEVIGVWVLSADGRYEENVLGHAGVGLPYLLEPGDCDQATSGGVHGALIGASEGHTVTLIEAAGATAAPLLGVELVNFRGWLESGAVLIDRCGARLDVMPCEGGHEFVVVGLANTAADG